MDKTAIIQLAVILILVLFSAFFSSAETAFSTTNAIRVKALADEGNRKAKLVLKILENYSRMLSTILVGNNIVNISASSLATVFATRQFGSYAIGIATGVLTIVVLLFGEIIPKTWAKLNNDKIALFYAPFINFLCIIFLPIVYIIDILSIGLLKLLGLDPNKKEVMTENELLSYVDAGHEDGVIEKEEKKIIHNMFDFSDAYAKDIMIPRINIVMAEVTASYGDVKKLFADNMYTRIPVYENTTDNIIGVINIKDFLFCEEPDKFKIKTILRKVYYTYEYKKTADLLNEMREKSETVSIVLNEYGASEGMITMEDLLEEIVGEIRDEYDYDEKEQLRKVGDNKFIIEGSMKLEDINDQLELNLHSEDYDSIGGIIIEHLGDTLPKGGDEVTLDNGIVLRVEQFSNNRIESVSMVLPEQFSLISST